MSLKERLTEDMKSAMKAKEDGKLRLSVIRMVRSAVRQAEIDGKTELDDEGVAAIIGKELKSRRDSLEEFKKGGRDDLVQETEEEPAVPARAAFRSGDSLSRGRSCQGDGRSLAEGHGQGHGRLDAQGQRPRRRQTRQ